MYEPLPDRVWVVKVIYISFWGVPAYHLPNPWWHLGLWTWGMCANLPVVRLMWYSSGTTPIFWWCFFLARGRGPSLDRPSAHAHQIFHAHAHRIWVVRKGSNPVMRVGASEVDSTGNFLKPRILPCPSELYILPVFTCQKFIYICSWFFSLRSPEFVSELLKLKNHEQIYINFWHVNTGNI